MTFVTTSLAIAGLAAISIPILIHLLSRQRRRPIEWAAMRFLLEAFRKQRRRLRIQQLLLLAVRCLIVFLLGAALARPLLQHTGLLDPGGGRVVYLLIDDGLASSLTDNTGETSLKRQVDHAQSIIEALDPGDRVGVITAARPARAILTPPTSDHGAVLRLLRGLSPQDAPTDLVGAMTMLRHVLNEDTIDSNAQQFAYLLSDFRSGSASLDAPLPSMLRDLEDRVTLLAAPAAETPVANVTITDIEPVRSIIIPGAADGSGQITVRLNRSGGMLEADVTRVRLSGEGLATAEPRIVRWEPGQSDASVDFLLNFSGLTDQQIALTAQVDDDSIQADNQRYTVLDLRNRIRVVMLERRSFGFEARLDRLSAGQWIRRALEPREGGPLQIVEVEPAALSVADLRTADVVFASRPDLLSEDGWALLRNYVDRGGLLIVSPPGQLNVHQWAEQFTTAMDLPWRISPETYAPDSGVFTAVEQPRSELLRLLANDLSDLTRPVISTRVLQVDMQEAAGSAVLNFEGVGPMVLASSPQPQDLHGGNAQAVRSAGSGLVVLFTVAPELSWTNLPSKPLMVPLMHELVRQGMSSIRANQRIITGEQPVIAIHASASDLVDPQDHRIAIASGRPQQPLAQAGLYELRDAASTRLATLAVNVDPSSGRTDAQASSAVVAWLGGSGDWSAFDADDPAAMLRDVAANSPLAGLLLALLLFLVLLETILARRFSYSYEGQGSVITGGLKPTIHQHTVMGGAA